MNTNLSSTPIQPAPLFILDELAECKNTDSTQESALVLVKESTLLRRKMDKYSHLLDSNMLVKAYLRRGLAYERLDKVIKAREDFYKVKSFDLNNK